MAKTFTYNKQEKLKSRKQLEALFAKGKSLLFFPVKVIYLMPDTPMDNLIKTGVGASSRTFKKAVQRNRIKRLLREAYRLHKHPLHRFLEEHNCQLILFLLYIDKGLPRKNSIEAKMGAILDKLMQDLSKQLDKDVAPPNTHEEV